MDPVLITLIACIALLVLLALRVHVGLALALAGLLGVTMLGTSPPGSLLQAVPFTATASYSWTVLPMFVLMGICASASGLVASLFQVANKALRRVPGGIAVATIAGCAGFGAVSGSSVATAATLGPIAGSEMAKAGYRPSFAAGVIAAGGTLGVLIPPSIILVLYGIVTGEPIGTLLIAGVVPGIISAVVLSLFVVGLRLLRPRTVLIDSALTERPRAEEPARVLAHSGGPARTNERPSSTLASESSQRPSAGDSRPMHSATGALLRLTILVLPVLGGIYLGVVTTTEAAAVGAFVAILVACFDLRHTGLRTITATLGRAFQDTAATTGMLFLIVVGASIFSYFFVVAGVPSLVAEWVVSLDAPPLVVVSLILLAMVPLGMFLEPISIVLIVIPLAYPIVVVDYGFSGIWFAILAVKMIELGLITPPVGLNVFVVAGVMRPLVTTAEAFRGVAWFVVADLCVVGLILLVPEIVTTWLPAGALH